MCPMGTGSLRFEAAKRVSAAKRGRVAPGGSPPRAPTDPDVRVDASGSSVSRVRCSTVDRVDDLRRRQWIALLPPSEGSPPPSEGSPPIYRAGGVN